jgi:hypothetical protein
MTLRGVMISSDLSTDEILEVGCVQDRHFHVSMGKVLSARSPMKTECHKDLF